MSARGLASSPESRIKSLQQKHHVISGQIEKAQASPSTTDFYLRQLKKQRLFVKDELERVRKKVN